MGEVLTAIQAFRAAGVTRPKGERLLWEYREVLPTPQRIGSARVFPASIVEQLRELARREAECRR